MIAAQVQFDDCSVVEFKDLGKGFEAFVCEVIPAQVNLGKLIVPLEHPGNNVETLIAKPTIGQIKLP